MTQPGAPLVSAIPREYPVVDRARLEMYPDNDLVVGPWRPQRPGPNGAPVQRDEGSAWGGASPAGVEPLPVDLFTTKDFYSMAAFFADIQEQAVGRQPQVKIPTAEQQKRWLADRR